MFFPSFYSVQNLGKGFFVCRKTILSNRAVSNLILIRYIRIYCSFKAKYHSAAFSKITP